MTAPPVTVAPVVMAHPSRRRWVAPLAARIGHGVATVFDRGRGRWDTACRALETAAALDADRVLLVQDDALVCDRLVDACGDIGAHAGDRPVGLYVGNLRPRAGMVAKAIAEAQASGASFVAMAGPWWAVAVMIPTVDVPDLVADGTRLHNRNVNIDHRLTMWYRRRGVDCWYTLPSLIDHRRENENPSLVTGRRGDRWAPTFPGEQFDATTIDWSLEPWTPTSRSLRALRR